MTTLEEQAILTSTDAVAVESSSTSPRSTTQNNSQTTTAADGSTLLSSVEVISVSMQTSDSDEIVTISRQIRRALECPICLTLVSVIACYCPDGHAMCEPCMLTLLNTNSARENPCPLCRTLMLQSLGTSTTVVKLTESSTLVKVTCSNWQHGCTELISVRCVSNHESECPHVPTILQCQVTMCQWLGMYEQLFEHVSSSHSGLWQMILLKHRNYIFIIFTTYTPPSRITAKAMIQTRRNAPSHSSSLHEYCVKHAIDV
ncbi:E3 ubiquitin-protein ligase sina-like [Aphis gossypii]|uniref:E3 ubiquitin-protein ligase sina-like n=1 Tax=Aphis gossypii TaxID=80765 RepID=UPI002158CFAE|nr:E3 ubiquitin-protein ligase sina-like [Aphis gossypii]